MSTKKLIKRIDVGAGGASAIDFTAIDATYDDLLLELSLAWVGAHDTRFLLRFNADSGVNYSFRLLQGNGTSNTFGTASGTSSIQVDGLLDVGAGIFGDSEIYIPSYLSANYKVASVDIVNEANVATAYHTIMAGLWSSASAINEITLTPFSGLDAFAQFSSASLYGIKNT